MKAQRHGYKAYSFRRFGKGSNGLGGIFVTIIIETEAEAEIFEAKIGSEVTIAERLTKHSTGVPTDGGPNPKWETLTGYLKMKPLEWLKVQLALPDHG